MVRTLEGRCWITEFLVQQHSEVAAALARAAVPRMAEISPCDRVADATTECASRFINDFGLEAYRRSGSAVLSRTPRLQLIQGESSIHREGLWRAVD